MSNQGVVPSKDPQSTTAPPSSSSTVTTVTLNLDDDATTRLCVGTWAWGDTNKGRIMSKWAQTGSPNTDSDNRDAFFASVAAGVRFFDTAEIYSFGLSEKLLGRFIAEAESSGDPSISSARIIVATKFAPLPYRIRKSCLRNALMESLRRIGRSYVDLYQVHSANVTLRSVEVWAEALAAVYREGLVRSVGVSNYNSDQVRRTHAVLAKHGVPLLSLQIEYSLLHRLPETSGLIQTCKDLGVKVLAYSPMAMGRLTGKYRTQQQLDGIGSRQFGKCKIEKLLPLLDAMTKIGADHGGKTCGQVALNWVACKGAIPIAGSKNARQATENAGGVMGWSLTPQEIELLDSLSVHGTTSIWQGNSK